ncbi:MAG: SMC-Scp complex subunit ScpB [Ignavibacteria bacterium]|nr:SMC-Scp complex subunit ScpB [Ignavibacteria bacterium]
MSNKNLRNIIEALIFASDEELNLEQIKNLLQLCNISASLKEIQENIENINKEYEKNGNAFEIIQIAGGYQFATRKEYAEYISKMKIESQRKKLSQSALETLAIIAYKQPITRSEIEFIRGVNVDYIVNSLLEKDLIMIKGRANSPGRPIIYGTTDNFLKILGLNSLEDLPKLKEINEILKNEKIEGIKEEDIELFNSLNNIEANTEKGLFNNTNNIRNANISDTTTNISMNNETNKEQ